MFPKGFALGGLLQQAQQVQEKIEELQGELATLQIEGQAGGGLVSVVVNGKQELKKVKIDPELLSEDVEMVEDLIVAAVRQAMEKAQAESQKRMSQLSGSAFTGLDPTEL
jgi:hypothetical protein